MRAEKDMGGKGSHGEKWRRRTHTPPKNAAVAMVLSTSKVKASNGDSQRRKTTHARTSKECRGGDGIEHAQGEGDLVLDLELARHAPVEMLHIFVLLVRLKVVVCIVLLL